MWLSLKISVKKNRPRKWIDTYVSNFLFEMKYRSEKERHSAILFLIK
jgi:hypothetical protein